MFTRSELDLVELCSEDMSFNDFERQTLKNVVEKIKSINAADTPSILIRISGGSFDVAYGNQDIDLIIEDADNIERGGDLYYPCLTSYSAEVLVSVLEEIKIKINASKFEEIRIFTADSNHPHPINLSIGGEFTGTFKTPQEAIDYIIKEGIV